MMNSTKAKRVLKAADSARYKIALKRERAFLMPFIKRGEPWAELAAERAATFALTVDELLKRYRRRCIKLIRDAELFGVAPVKKYRANEYLDERYDRVVVPDVRDVLTEMTTALESDLKREYQKQIASGFVPESAELIYGSTGMDFSFNKFDEQTRDYLRDKTIKWSKQVAQETERAVRRELVNGYEKGLDVDEITRNIEKSTGFSYERSELIARTEIMSAESYAEYTERLANPNVIGAKWVSAHDEKTRPTHRAADGQERKLGEPFDIGGYKMLHKGDSSLGAPAKEIINCRCTTISILRDTPIESNTVYDEPDAGTDEWLKRQPEEFREEYIGGKVKARLFDSGDISIGDSRKNASEIIAGLTKKTVKNAEAIKNILSADVNNATYMKSVTTHLLEVQLRGIRSGKEYARVLDHRTGKVITNGKLKNLIIGNESSIALSDEVLNEINKEENRYVLIHNHPNGMSFSFDDIIALHNNKGVKASIAIGHNGAVYYMSGRGMMENLPKNEKERKDFATKMNKAIFMEAVRRYKRIYGREPLIVDRFFKMVYNYVVKTMLKKLGFEYEERF